MAKVKVYYFMGYDHGSGNVIRSAHPATLEAIDRVKGTPIVDSGVEIDESELDGNGFQKKAG